jgi:branched-chain amino acid transport system ATP-binding protein
MLLEVKDLEVGYFKRVVVQGVSLAVDEREIVAIIGHNGAGKTTTLKGIFGFLKPVGGEILYRSDAITGRSPLANVRDGITYTPQERFTFPELSVMENLRLGGYTLHNDLQARIEMVYETFPVLKERAWQRASTLSGGERRMLGLGMALITRPKLMLLDEPSLGLSPVMVQSLTEALRQIRDTFGTAIVLVEQNVKQALRLANRAYVMKVGRIILEEKAEKLLAQGQWWDLF